VQRTGSDGSQAKPPSKSDHDGALECSNSRSSRSQGLAAASRTSAVTLAEQSGVSRAWSGVLAVAGAAAGIAAFVYFVGAVTVWVRLKAAQLPADLAIAHWGRSELIAVGVRGTLLVALAVALGYFVLVVPRRTLAGGLAHVGPWWRWAALLAAVVTTVALAFTTWRYFGIALALLIAGTAMVRYLDARRYSGRPAAPSLAVILALVLAAAIAAIASQVNGVIAVRTAIVTQLPNASLERLPEEEDVPVPYFGETSDLVYLAELSKVRPDGEGGYTWRYGHSLMEIPRDQVLLIHQTDPACLRNELKSPAEAIADLVRGGPFVLQEETQPQQSERREPCG
jgi:hypothetical protein